MEHRKTLTATVTLIAVIALVGAVLLSRAAPAASTGADPRGGNREAQEQQLGTELREEALAEAEAAGRFGSAERITSRAAAGWAGETLFKAGTDDWEPAIAADPASGFVYALATRYGVKPCQGKCPSPATVIQVSSNNGQTWTDRGYICPCKGASGQFDPIIEVVPGTGAVYAVWMNDFNVVFSKSTDHAQTWSTPVKTYGNVSWNDKPVLATSDNGQHVYVSWNGPTGGDPYVAQSHDFGVTWTQTKIVNSARYFFAFDADVLSDGTVIFSESSLTYTGPGAAPEGVVQQHVLISRTQGATWENQVLDSVEIGTPCIAAGCPSDYYLGHSAVTADATGKLTVLYDGATSAGGPQRIWTRRSVDGGLTWSGRTALSVAGENATTPAAEATGNGDVRAWYMQTNGNADAWNVWYRASTDGGLTWAAPVKISDATSGAAYKDAAGFDEPYGDYGEIAITSTGKAIAIWGEGFSYTGPGGAWLNRQT